MSSTTMASGLRNFDPMEKVEQVTWGRRSTAALDAHLGAMVVIPLLPFWMLLNWATLESSGGSLAASLHEIGSRGPVTFVLDHLPTPTVNALIGYIFWILLQALLYTILPGTKCSGQMTPGGHVLGYVSNGLLAWACTHVFYVLLVLQGLDPAIIAREWEGLFVSANLFASLVGLLLYLKAFVAPSYVEDNKITGSWPFDFAFGIELNPRIGRDWDLKFFFNGRVGLVAWTLIDISWAAYQYQRLGFVTNSMLIVIILHTIYVVDFFWNEDWYTRTIDITYDHLGWILAWGDAVLLPSFYTLQAQYLARYSFGHMPVWSATLVLLAGLGGFALFRSANNQRDVFRQGKLDEQTRYIQCTYSTSDGKRHESKLLISGWWGLVRHPNYLGDLIQAFAMCATCGFSAVLPWSYFFYMTVLLVFRAMRDHRKCRNKYGKAWDGYCEMVPFQLIPWIW